ncbi:MAG TPA: biopolymer transporter ExbD [Opitutaceae bacterium]
MIARPLDLASRLRPVPHGTGALHYVNVGLLGIFFMLFGSKFVLAPGLGVDFQIPEVEDAQSGAARANHVISVLRSGQIFSEDGLIDVAQLRAWLKAKAPRSGPAPTLLVRASSGVTLSKLIEIEDAAHEAGFRVLLGAEESRPSAGPVEAR